MILIVFLLALSGHRWHVDHDPGAHMTCLRWNQDKECIRHATQSTWVIFEVTIPKGTTVWAEVFYPDRMVKSNELKAE